MKFINSSPAGQGKRKKAPKKDFLSAFR